MDQLGRNAFGEVLEPGRVADCYLGLLLPPGPAGELEAGTVLVVAPAALLHPGVPQPAGSLVYKLLTGHPEREAGELVFVAHLTGELRAWPHDTWAKIGVDPQQVAQAVIGCWQDGEVTGLQVDDLSFEEARSLTRPAMTYVRGQLRGRLTARLVRVRRRWLHPTSGRQPGDQFPSPPHGPLGCCHAERTPTIPTTWTRPWPAIAAVPGPCPAARHASCHVRGATTATITCPHWWPVGERWPDIRPERQIAEDTSMSPPPAWPRVPDTARPDGGHSGSSGRSIR